MNKRLVSLVLALMIVLLSCPVSAMAADTGRRSLNIDQTKTEASSAVDDSDFAIPEAMEGETINSGDGGYITFVNPGRVTPSGGKPARETASFGGGDDDLPEYYNSNALGLVTPVKEQQYGDCWAHAAIASCETNMIKNGVNVTTAGSYDGKADLSLDLAENPLCSYTFNGIVDMLGIADDESSEL